MILTRAPLRVSFIGGGTDYRSFIQKHGGVVLAGAIKKFVYVSLLPLPTYANETFRFTYRRTESVRRIDEFQHPSLRETLKFLDWNSPISIATMSDVPGNTGLGSSSAFVVALRLALQAHNNEGIAPRELADFAILIERDTLGEAGGLQDQYEAAFGGLRVFQFSADSTTVGESLVGDDELMELGLYFSLVATRPREKGLSFGKETSGAPIELLLEMKKEALRLSKEFSENTSSYDRAMTLSKAIEIDWSIKRQFYKDLSGREVSETIKQVSKNGALSWKLCGAGGSGFVLVSHHPEDAHRIRGAFDAGFVHPVQMHNCGAELMLNSE
jgi:D-glycero-alpha-D-manno-heptose-7-phosphate kinase